jgi:hypothetical protein
MNKAIYFVLGGVVVAAIAIVLFTLPDRRTTGERVGDAVDALPHGVNAAAGQLRDRTPAEKAGDAIQKADDKAKDATPQNRD